jgi:hypothetical protein
VCEAAGNSHEHLLPWFLCNKWNPPDISLAMYLITVIPGVPWLALLKKVRTSSHLLFTGCGQSDRVGSAKYSDVSLSDEGERWQYIAGDAYRVLINTLRLELALSELDWMGPSRRCPISLRSEMVKHTVIHWPMRQHWPMRHLHSAATQSLDILRHQLIRPAPLDYF